MIVAKREEMKRISVRSGPASPLPADKMNKDSTLSRERAWTSNSRQQAVIERRGDTLLYPGGLYSTVRSITS